MREKVMEDQGIARVLTRKRRLRREEPRERRASRMKWNLRVFCCSDCGRLASASGAWEGEFGGLREEDGSVNGNRDVGAG